MSYGELIRLYFDRCNALQRYWTLYVVIIGGLLAFSSLRRHPDLVTAILVTVLYCFFAYKNLDAIHDAGNQRLALLQSLQELPATSENGSLKQRVEPTLAVPAWPGVRNFHVTSDILTLAAVWGMEWRRRIVSRATAHRLPSAP